MKGASDPHVSAALKHLRPGVTGAGVVLALCLIAQMLVWGFIHFTDVRHETLEVSERESQPLTVVNSTGAPSIPVIEQVSEDGADINRVEGASSVMLENVAGTVQTVGVFAAIILFVLMFQGVMVAGGGNVPGVGHAVAAGTWALVLVLLAMPWRGFFPEMGYAGVFRGYEGMIAASESLGKGGSESMGRGAFYGTHLVLPLLLIAGVAATVLRFRAGVEAGVIVTHASQLDEKLEREIRDRKLGELSQPRAVGASNSAIGLASGPEVVPAPVAPPPPPPVAAKPRSPMSARPHGEEPPAMATPNPPGSPKRPI